MLPSGTGVIVIDAVVLAATGVGALVVAPPDHRGLLPASMLLGSALLLLSDVTARLLLAPAELPLGIITALLGAPFFLSLLIRVRRQGGF